MWQIPEIETIPTTLLAMVGIAVYKPRFHQDVRLVRAAEAS
jgi:hypothetical protein